MLQSLKRRRGKDRKIKMTISASYDGLVWLQ
jgi:hypothetical protein